jgi:hypothetical protein
MTTQARQSSSNGCLVVHKHFLTGIILTPALARLAWFAHDAAIRVAQAVTMARNDQPDLFGAEEQTELFDENAAPPAYRADPDKVRARLHKILAEARAAQKLPWEPARVLLYRTIFPQMTNWLPEEEGAQLRFEFESEMARLKAA